MRGPWGPLRAARAPEVRLSPPVLARSSGPGVPAGREGPVGIAAGLAGGVPERGGSSLGAWPTSDLSARGRPRKEAGGGRPLKCAAETSPEWRRDACG